MKLPDILEARIPADKIRGYLLSATHRTGRHKTRFFSRFGFAPEAWAELAEALRRHAAEHDVRSIEKTSFGTRYTVEGILRTPDGRTPYIRSVWFVEYPGDTPRFVTAYPVRRRSP